MNSARLLILFFICGILTSLNAKAEYRVYQYYVKSKIHQPQDKEAYKVTSTLNPVAYKAYHGGDEAIKVDLIRTWSCKGHTGRSKPICDSPTEKALKE